MIKNSPYDNSNFISRLFFLYARAFISNPEIKYKPPEDLLNDSLASKIIKD